MGYTVRGSNPGGGEIFRTCPERPCGHPASYKMSTAPFPGAKSGQGVTLTVTPFYCRGQERVELYLYSPYGPYGLYRASAPVQRCTLPYLKLKYRSQNVKLHMPACQLRVLTLPNYRCLHSKLCQLTCYIRIKTKEADNLAVSSTGTKYQCRLDRRLSAVSPGDSGASRHHVFPSNAFATHLHTIQATCHTIRYNLHGSNGGFQNANINSH